MNPSRIRHRLEAAAVAALRGDRAVLEETAAWLISVTARELLRIDHFARWFRHEGPTLGTAEKWTAEVLASPLPVVAVLASMHPDGHVRERAVRSLATSPEALSARALAVRVTDHVEVVRERAAREVLRRTTLDHADHVAPLLHRVERRGRGADVLPEYLRALVAEHGEADLWARLRGCQDRELRRLAFAQSVDSGLLGLPDAVGSLRRERDQVVRRQLIRVIADSAPPDLVAEVLLRDGSAESRALALAKLTARELAVADVRRLLVDSSMLVRLWARRRWRELGHDPVAVYAEVARSTATPAVRARAWTGLVETGTAIEHREILDLVRGAELPLRKVGLTLLRGGATTEEIPLLLRLVAGEDARVARLAGDVLVASQRLWTLEDLAPLRTAEDPELRRRAWWLHRHRGGWEAVVADLELGHDPDPRLAALARRPVLPMYFQPTETQRRRIAELLATAPLDRHELLDIAFAAGLPDPGS